MTGSRPAKHVINFKDYTMHSNDALIRVRASIVVSHDIVVIVLPDLGGVHECELTDDYCKRYFLVGLLLREVSTNICARIVFQTQTPSPKTPATIKSVQRDHFNFKTQ